MDSAELKYIIFHIDEEWSSIHELKEIFESQPQCEKYFIAFEQNPRNHYHLLAFCSEQTYNTLIRHIKKHFNLEEKQKKLRLGKNKGGHCLYTRPTAKTRSWEGFLTYVQKEHKVLTTTNPFPHSFSKGFDLELLEKLKNDSFQKNEPKKNLDIIINFLETKGPFGIPKFEDININPEKQLPYPYQPTTRPQHFTEHTQSETLYEIYKFINENPKISLSLSKTAINNYYLNYLRKTQHYNMRTKIALQMYFNNHQ